MEEVPVVESEAIVDVKSGLTMSPAESYTSPKFNVPTIQVSTDGEYVPSIDEMVKSIYSRETPQADDTDGLK